jgi:hypothetical protein
MSAQNDLMAALISGRLSIPKWPCVSLRQPFTFSDELPVFVSLQIKNNYLLLSDFSKTFFHLLRRGIDLRNGKRFRQLACLIDRHDVNLNERGELQLVSSVENLSNAYMRFVSLLFGIADWEIEQYSLFVTSNANAEKTKGHARLPP